MSLKTNGSFSFFTPVNIFFGRGSRYRIEQITVLKNSVSMVFLYPQFSDTELLSLLKSICKKIVISSEFQENPADQFTKNLAEKALKEKIECIIAIGGGSTIDTAKAVSLRYMQINGKDTTIPVIALPTTAGTGSEVTPYAVLTDKNKKKFFLSDPLLFPKYAVCDPELTLTMPHAVTVFTGIDALCHALEGFFTVKCNFFMEDIVLRACSIISSTLAKVINEPNNIEYRSKMLEASLLAGIILANCGTVIVHSLGYNLTNDFAFVHGKANSVFLPAFMELAFKKNPERAGKVLQYFNNDLHCFLAGLDTAFFIPEEADNQQIKAWSDAAYACYGRQNCIFDITREEISGMVKNCKKSIC